MLTLLCTGISKATAQVTISPDTKLRINGTIMIKGAVNNQSTQTELNTADVLLSGSNQTISTTIPVELKSLTITGGGTKTVNGFWSVNETLSLTNGIVQVSPSAKLTYNGAAPLQGNESAYVTGPFYYSGSGRLFFPIGTVTRYAPAIIENASSGEYGIRVIASDPLFALPDNIESYYQGHYWEMDPAPNATMSFSLSGMESFLEGNAPVVLEAPAPGGIASSLSGTTANTFVTSSQPVSQPIAGIGATPEFRLTIHDMITPYTQDDVNDKLYIRNIELTTSNKVRLLDRYGVVVREWTNYTNDNEVDFQQFSPGNYICVVEYTTPGGSTKQSAKGMVTILKTN
jgi:hypothetical protein